MVFELLGLRCILFAMELSKNTKVISMQTALPASSSPKCFNSFHIQL